MHLASRPALVRLIAIDAAISKGGWPNASTLSRQLEVSPRTIYRDIDLLRDQLHAPLAFDAQHNGYGYTQPNYRLPVSQLTEGELIAVAVAERVLQQYRGTPFEEDLRRALARICTWLPESVSVDLAALGDALSVLPAGRDLLDIDIFKTLDQAVRQRRQLAIRYWTASRNATSNRRIDPYHLAVLDHDWYVIGFDSRQKRVLTFKVVRIRCARPTGKTFDRPTDFDIEDYLGDAFRAMRGTGQHEVVLRFTPAVAGRVAEKHWHASQRLEHQRNGSLIMRLVVSDLTEVQRWVQTWGAEVVVLEPEELRSRLREELQRTLRSYGGHRPRK